MSDLIDRQAAIDALGKEPEVWTGKDEYAQGLNNQWHYDVNALKAVPSAQPEIIRCKDCRWAREACGGNIECFADINEPPEYHGYEWFCPNGERRTDE